MTTCCKGLKEKGFCFICHIGTLGPSVPTTCTYKLLNKVSTHMARKLPNQEKKQKEDIFCFLLKEMIFNIIRGTTLIGPNMEKKTCMDHSCNMHLFLIDK